MISRLKARAAFNSDIVYNIAQPEGLSITTQESRKFSRERGDGHYDPKLEIPLEHTQTQTDTYVSDSGMLHRVSGWEF